MKKRHIALAGLALCALLVPAAGNAQGAGTFPSFTQFSFVEIIDASNPANPVRLGGHNRAGSLWARGVAVVDNRIYVTSAENGQRVFCTLPNVQQMLRVTDGTSGTPYTIEVATNLAAPVSWMPLLTTNPAALPFEFTDCDVRCPMHPQKFYRVGQP